MSQLHVGLLLQFVFLENKFLFIFKTRIRQVLCIGLEDRYGLSVVRSSNSLV